MVARLTRNSNGGAPGFSTAPTKKVRARLDPAAGEVAAAAKGLRHRDQLGAVEVEDALGLRLVPGGHVITGQAADVLDPVHRRAHQVRLQREPVAVAAAELHDGLDSRALHADRHRERRGVGVR